MLVRTGMLIPNFPKIHISNMVPIVKQAILYINPVKNLMPKYTTDMAIISISIVEKLKLDKSNSVPP